MTDRFIIVPISSDDNILAQAPARLLHPLSLIRPLVFTGAVSLAAAGSLVELPFLSLSFLILIKPAYQG